MPDIFVGLRHHHTRKAEVQHSCLKNVTQEWSWWVTLIAKDVLGRNRNAFQKRVWNTVHETAVSLHK